MKGRVIPYIVFIICLYFSVHNFPLPILDGTFGTKNLLYIFFLIIVLVYGRSYLNAIKLLVGEFCLLFLAMVYVFIRTGFGGDLEFIVRHVFGIFDTFLVPLAIVIFALRNDISTENVFIRGILFLGAIASIISLLCFFYPPLQSYVKYTLLNVQPDSYLYWNEFRGFGLAQKLTSDYAFIQATIFVLGCFYAKDNKWFLYFLPAILFSVFFNARTGILILLGGMMIFVVIRGKGFSSFVLGFLALLVLFFLPEMMEMLGVRSDTVEWVSLLFNDIDTFATTGDITQTSTGGRLFGDMWILPTTSSEWLIGKGYSLFRHKTETSSDNGWILQLNYGGIIYMFFLYLIIIRMFSRLYKTGRKSFAFYFLLIFFIVNTKSAFLPNDEEFRLLMTIYMFYIFNDRNTISPKRLTTNEKSYLRSI